jgi:tetratricopeptide (TPR) repeat protein
LLSSCLTPSVGLEKIRAVTEAKRPAKPETIGQRLRRLRHERDLSQRDLSSPGVSYAYISRIEAGTRQPSVKALRKLARKLGVSAEYLETGSELAPAQERELRLADAELELRLADDPSGAVEALARLAHEAEEAGDVVALTRAHVGLGLAAARDSRHRETIAYLEPVTNSGLVSPAARPDVYATLGHSYSAIGQAGSAIELFEHCLRALDEDAPSYVTGRTRYVTYLSYALADAGELDRAERVAMEALGDHQPPLDPYSQVRLYWSIARVASMQGRQGFALEHARRAVALLEATEDTLHLARAHILYASILILMDSPERAREQLDVAARLFGPQPERGDLASLRNEQARCAALLGDGAEALVCAREALDLLGDDEPAEQGLAWAALGEALALEDDVDGAVDAFRRGIDLLSQQSRWRDSSQAARALGRLLRREGRESEALDALDRAAELAGRQAADVRLAR